MAQRKVHVSVVSHGQAALVNDLLGDIQQCCDSIAIQVTLTINIEEHLPFDPSGFSFPVHIVRNKFPRGFAANHNAAFHKAASEYPCPYFCVVNPDVRISKGVFDELLCCLENGNSIGAIAPSARNSRGECEDNARRLPTPLNIITRVAGFSSRHDYPHCAESFSPDWVAGVFMLFPSKAYAEMGGFDERYFLYCEDVDICARMRQAGYGVVLNPAVAIVHDAQRNSHGRLMYFLHHVNSLGRLFTSRVYRVARKHQRLCR